MNCKYQFWWVELNRKNQQFDEMQCVGNSMVIDSIVFMNHFLQRVVVYIVFYGGDGREINSSSMNQNSLMEYVTMKSLWMGKYSIESGFFIETPPSERRAFTCFFISLRKSINSPITLWSSWLKWMFYIPFIFIRRMYTKHI